VVLHAEIYMKFTISQMTISRNRLATSYRGPGRDALHQLQTVYRLLQALQCYSWVRSLGLGRSTVVESLFLLCDDYACSRWNE
jgi:hypothetical protein